MSRGHLLLLPYTFTLHLPLAASLFLALLLSSSACVSFSSPSSQTFSSSILPPGFLCPRPFLPSPSSKSSAAPDSEPSTAR